VALPPILYGTAASGDLAGAYPNPVIADGAVLRKHIAVGAVGADEIEDGTLTAIKFATSGTGLGQVITSPDNIASGVVTPAHMAMLASYVRTQGNQSISGIKSFERLVLFRWAIQPYDVTNKHYVDSMILSGTGANMALEPYASGTKTLLNTIQNNETILIAYASGIGTLAGLTQVNLTASNNTTSGLITTVQNLQLYASGIETLRRAMVSTGTNPELETYASGIETMRRQMGTVPVNVTGDSIKATLVQTNTFNPFDCLYYDGSYKLAQANIVATADALGVVESVSGNSITVVYDGKLTITSGSIIPGVQYFLSHANAGQLITDDPATFGYISKPVLTSITNTVGVVNIQRGILGDIASGMQTFRLDAIETYSSGIETLRQAMTGTNPELESYASGIETLRRAMVSSGANPELEAYASGIETMRQAMNTAMPHCFITHSGTQSIPNDSTTTVLYPTKIYETVAGMATLIGIQIPQTGYYLINAFEAFKNGTINDNTIRAILLMDSKNQYLASINARDTPYTQSLQISNCYYCQSGTIISTRLYQNSGLEKMLDSGAGILASWYGLKVDKLND
jgi:hypothetical protein